MGLGRTYGAADLHWQTRQGGNKDERDAMRRLPSGKVSSVKATSAGVNGDACAASTPA